MSDMMVTVTFLKFMVPTVISIEELVTQSGQEIVD